jgi:hypothetical protein
LEKKFKECEKGDDITPFDGTVHCKSGPHKNGIRKSSRKRYNHIMGI